MGSLYHDVRYSLRLLAKQRTMAAAILVTLALGIGANSAVFAVVQAVLLQPLPYPRPERLVRLWEQRPAESNYTNLVSPADFLDWDEMNASFSTMAGYAATTADLTGSGDPLQIGLATVTGRFFDVLGVRALHGRTFDADEDVLGREGVVVLGHRLWQQRFGGDLSVVGRRIVLNGIPREVIGVLGPNFEFPGEVVDVWAPLVLRGGKDSPPRALHYLQVFARLSDGVSLDAAQADLQRIGDRLAASYPVENEGHGPRVVSLREDTVAPARRGLLIVMAAVAFLMLIACTNVAHLLLARSASRRRELAIRAALGAARGRLLRQSLTESILLTLMGGTLGLIGASWALQLLVAETPPALSGAGLERARLNMPVLAFTALICCITAVIAGALPAWQVSRTEPGDPLRETGGRSPLALERSVRLMLIAGQVALTVLLLVGAGLMTRTFIRVLSQPAGFDIESRLTVNLSLPRTRYSDGDTIRRARRALDERFESIPGVIAFGATNNLPLTGSDSRQGITVEGFERYPGDDPVRAHFRTVSPRYFAAMGIALRAGRVFTESDDERGATVVVINETMARRYWPGQSAIGKRMRFNRDGEPWRQVIGVIADVRHWGLDHEVNPELYIPHAQQPSAALTYVFHTASDPTGIVAAVDAQVKAVDPDLPLGAVRTFDRVASSSMAARRWSALLLGVFALLGVALAAAGIYGVMSHLVALRTAEIGIRLSLGATRSTIFGLILSEALVNASVGLVLGLAAGLASARTLQSLLFEVPPADLVTFVGTTALVLAIAVLAALSPAMRAMQVDPVQALRQS